MTIITRRMAIGLTAATIVSAKEALAQAPASSVAPPVSTHFTLPPLGYAYEALEPHIDAATMNFHHKNHHNAFIGNLNGLVPRWDGLTKLSADAILNDMSAVPEAIRTAVRNNLGGHWNHSHFWSIMTPGGSKAPTGDLLQAINQSFGSFAEMQKQINQAGLTRFGSGWAWLVVNRDKKLAIVNTEYQNPPHLEGNKAVIGIDVWEHAYYLKHQNRRGEYLSAWWNVVNWDKALENFKKATA